MNETFVRTELLIGEDGLKKLRKARVAVWAATRWKRWRGVASDISCW